MRLPLLANVRTLLSFSVTSSLLFVSWLCWLTVMAMAVAAQEKGPVPKWDVPRESAEKAPEAIDMPIKKLASKVRTTARSRGMRPDRHPEDSACTP